MERRRGFLLYPDMYDMIEMLSMEERGEVMTAIFHQRLGLPVPDMNKHTTITYRYINGVIERDDIRYAARCEANRRNGIKGGRPRLEEAEVHEVPSEIHEVSHDSYDDLLPF